MPNSPGTTSSEPTAPSPDSDRAALRDMLLIRRFEEKAGQLYGMGFIAGYCHLCIGQEAVAVGLRMASSPGDTLITAYRNHGHVLAWGADPTAVFAELLGRADGLSGGKGGSMHLSDPGLGVYGGHGIVGANVPIGAGLAFASAYRKNAAINWCILGDAAADQGQVYETMAMAARWSLPMVFVIENNRPEEEAGSAPFPSGSINAEARDTEPHAAPPPLAERGHAFAIPGYAVDGMDPHAVMTAARDAAHRARTGQGPTILEMRTQAYRGHSIADPAKYQGTAAGTPPGRTRDPIDIVKARLLRSGDPEDTLRSLDKDARDRVNAAARIAQSADEPAASELTTDCLAAR